MNCCIVSLGILVFLEGTWEVAWWGTRGGEGGQGRKMEGQAYGAPAPLTPATPFSLS